MNGFVSVLPYVLILACPLMMIFMMKGMRRGGDTGHGTSGSVSADPAHDARIAELERQVGGLRGRPSGNLDSDSRGTDRR